MKTKLFNLRLFVIGSLLFSSLILNSGCSNDPREEIKTESDAELLKLSEFKNDVLPALGSIKAAVMNDETLWRGVVTRSATELPSEITEHLNAVSAEAYLFLKLNRVDVTEFVDENDPRLAIVAMALIEADQFEISTRTTLGGCVLEAVGVGSLVKGGLKKIAKRVLKKIPYVGAVVAAVDFVMCMVE